MSAMLKVVNDTKYQCEHYEFQNTLYFAMKQKPPEYMSRTAFFSYHKCSKTPNSQTFNNQTHSIIQLFPSGISFGDGLYPSHPLL